MPNFVDHSVYNLEETVSIGDNYLYPSCLEELGVTGVEKRLHMMLKRMDEPSARRLREPVEQSKRAMRKISKTKEKGGTVRKTKRALKHDTFNTAPDRNYYLQF